MTTRLYRVVTLLGALACLTGTASAQGAEGTSPDIRETCTRSRNIVAAVRSGAYDAPTRNALVTLGRCSRSAGTAIPRLWTMDVTEPRALTALITGSRGVRDQRIFAAAARVAEDASRPRAMRQAALIIITSYVKTDLSAVAGQYDRRGTPPELAFYPMRLSHADQEVGEQAVPQNVRVRVEAILKSLVSAKHGALEDLAQALLLQIST